MPRYNTINEAISAMRDRGFTNTFSIQHNELYCSELSQAVAPEQLTLIEKHQVGEHGNKSGTHEVYGFRTDDNNLGLMTSTYAEYDPEGFRSIFTRCKQTKDLR
jgi:hypothetical protein